MFTSSTILNEFPFVESFAKHVKYVDVVRILYIFKGTVDNRFCKLMSPYFRHQLSKIKLFYVLLMSYLVCTFLNNYSQFLRK